MYTQCTKFENSIWKNNKMCFHNLHDVSLLFCNLEFLHFFWKRLLSNWTLLCLFAKARLEFLHFVWFRWICKYCINQNFSICKSSGINYSIYKLKKEYTNSLVNADLFYSNFTNKKEPRYTCSYESKGTLASGKDVGQGINVGPGKFGKKNKRRALNTHVLCSK
jgi:hypothetical protein